jgi:hypothetical protein
VAEVKIQSKTLEKRKKTGHAPEKNFESMMKRNWRKTRLA